jgi:hypothetical protein
MTHPTSSSIAVNLCQRFGCGKEDAIIALKLARGVTFAQPSSCATRACRY